MKSASRVVLSALVAAGVLSAAPAFASEDEIDQATRAKVVEMLQAKGYEVRKVEREDDEIEAYALKDGHRYEIYLDETLNIVREKQS